MAMTEHAVVIVGGGPTGLMLAGELALAQVDVAIVERRQNQDLAGSRAGGLHARTIEIFDQRGADVVAAAQFRRYRRYSIYNITISLLLALGGRGLVPACPLGIRGVLQESPSWRKLEAYLLQDRN